MIPGVVSANIKSLKTELSAEVYPALIGVGYICGPKISSYMLAGGILGWFVFIPAIATFGANTILYPGTDTIMNIYAVNGASALWSYYIRYIGAGMVAAGGIISLIKSMPLIVKTFTGAMKGIKNAGGAGTKRTDQDMNMKVIICGVAGIILLIWLLPQIPVSLVGAILIALFGFFFGAVSSRMVGLVGSSNNPVSGMSIATLLFATLILKLSGDTGAHGMIGAFVAALTIGGVLILLDKAWGFGTTELAAPQATLMKMIVEGVMDGNLPWTLVFIGIFTALVVEILGIPVLPVAIGLYLPLELSTTIMLGGIIRWFADKKSKNKNDKAGSGVLFCSGMIAGEGLVGIILAVLAVIGIDSKIDLSGSVNLGTIGGIILLAVTIGCVAYFAMQKKTVNSKEKEKSEE